MNAVAPIIAAGSFDPVFDALERVNLADQAIDADRSSEVPDALVNAFFRQVQDLASVSPTTREGRKALLERMFEIEDPNAWDRESPMVLALINVVNAEYGLNLEA